MKSSMGIECIYEEHGTVYIRFEKSEYHMMFHAAGVGFFVDEKVEKKVNRGKKSPLSQALAKT